MSRTVDSRVVEMQFDNKRFEQNVATTMSTLEKLKERLNLTGASKGLEEVDKASRRIDMTPLANGVETVRTKFSALQVMGITALTNITNQAVNAGKRIASALTIDPIKTGLSEYETQINAVQTILANTESKGTTLGQVNAALDELNTYADKTIYNFTEMTRNIGTFTAAGVDLKTSVNAIQGIANLAAVSGSSSQQASTAMYQLSQALSSGTVKLMDWNSVVNAGMGGQVFQDALKETARVHGIAIDDMITKNGSFRETLQEGWLTADILTETLSHFTMAAEEGSETWEKYKKSLQDDGYTAEQAEAILKLSNTATDAATKVKTATQLWETLKETAQSGWTQTWEIILGDFGEAKEMFSGMYEMLSPMLEASAKARNELLSGGLSSGWKQLMGQGIADEEGYRDTVQQVAKDHGVAIDEMIEKEGSFDAALKAGLKDGSITSDMLSESVTKLADKMRGMSEAERDAAGYTKDHIEQIEALEAGLKDGSISMDEFAKKIMRPSGRENLIESLYNTFKAVISVITPIKEAFRDIFPAMQAEQLYAITENLKKFTEKLTLGETASNNLKRTFRGLFAILDIIRQAFSAVFKIIKPLFGRVDELGGGILDTTAKWGDWLVELNKSIKANETFEKVVTWVHEALKKVGAFLKPVAEGFKSFSESVVDAFKNIAGNVHARVEPLTAIGEFFGSIFAGIGKAITKIAPGISEFIRSIGAAFDTLMSKIGSSIQSADYNALFDMFNSGVFAAIGVFIAKFMKSADGILDNAGGFLENINGILEGVGDSLQAFSQQLKAKTLMTIASAIAILAASLIALSLVDSERLTVALAAITGLMLELMGAMSIFSKIAGGMSIKNMFGMSSIGKALKSIASALLVLAIAMKIMSTMSWEEMFIGLVATIGGLGAMVGAVNLLPEKKVNGAAKAIKKLSAALLVFAVAMKIMGTMSWEELAVGLAATVGGLGAMVGAVNLLPKNMGSKAVAMIGIATALVILSGALKIMATMSWDEIARSLTVLAGSLLVLSAAMAMMKRAIPGAAAMMIVAPALVVLAGALKLMGGLSWEEIARGLVTLGGSLLIISAAMAMMKRAIFGAAALLVVSAALMVLAPVLKLFGSMSLAEIGKSLLVLAGAFTVIGLAGLILKPLIPTLLGLATAVTLFGVGCAAVGAGVLLLATGLGLLATAGAGAAAAIVAIVSGLIGLIPYVIEQIGVGIIRFCEAISGGAAAICEAVKVIILAVVDALVASVPAIVEGVFVLVDSLLGTLVEYTPKIVEKLFDFLIGILEAVAKKLPDLIQAGVNLVMAFFSGLIDALKTIDPSVLVNGILAVGLLTALMTALAAMALLAPAAMIGVVAMGAVIAELAIVLAAIGALAQIPGLEWLIKEGGAFMQTIGTAIGQFIGGIVGGIAQGITSSLPQIGTDLSNFMANIQPFIDGAKAIDASVLDGVKNLVGVILALTGANIIESLTSWLTGGSSLADFGSEIAAFGPSLKAYADAVAGIDATAITASATAAKALSEMAANLPNSGGLAGLLAGENGIGTFGDQLVPFGEGMKAYAQAVTGIDTQAIVNSAAAAKAIVDMSNCIPNSGGLAALITGDNSLAKFSGELIMLGMGLKGFAMATTGIVPETIIAAAGAAKALAEMTQCIPNSGGMAAWFTGDNSISKFSGDLIMLGMGLRGFATVTTGIVPETIIAAAGAAKALAEMTQCIPNSGGMAAWFTGDNSISKFSTDLVLLGQGLQGFATATTGIVPENITAAAGAARALAEMTQCIPNSGGMAAWFTGESSLSKFGTDLTTLGEGLAGFSTATTDLVPENVTAAAGAAKALAEMTAVIPTEGGLKAWFSGESGMATFADNLTPLGEGLKGFSDAVAGIVPENITAAASAAKSLADMTSVIPTEGGLKAWFSGESGVATFADNLPDLGAALKGFSDSVAGIVPENVTAAANAAKALGEMTATIPKNTDRIVDFGENIIDFGESLQTYFEKTSGITTESVSAVNSVIESVKNAASIGSGSIKGVANAIDDLVDSLLDLKDIDSSLVNGFKQALKALGETGADALVGAFDNIDDDMKKAGKAALDAFVDGVKAKLDSAKSSCMSIATKCATAISDEKTSFATAGKNLVKGFASGITVNTYLATAKARAMAKAAAEAAKKELDIQSPSRVFREIGEYVPEGFAQGIDRLGNLVTNSTIAMGKGAVNGVRTAITNMSSILDSDMDMQPTIRPVLDLSSVRAGASGLSSLFDSRVGVMANVGSINSMMNHRIQNGSTSDVVSAIDKLRKELGNVGNTTYQVNGVTYDDGSNISTAVREIARAAIRERRV